MTKNDIISNIDKPKALESLYRENSIAFKTEFNSLYPELTNNKLADFWNERLNYENDEISWGSNKELSFVIIASLLAGLVAKLPHLLNIDPELFYTRNLGFIVFPFLVAYFTWRNNLPSKEIVFSIVAFIIAVVFINLLPANDKSDTLILSCIHLPLFLWAILGFSFVGDDIRNLKSRLDFLRYNGDLLILTGLILISGMALTGVTIGLFSIIGSDIKEDYFNYFGIFGLAAAPLVATYVVIKNPQLVGKVSPVIAKIFSPLVFMMLVVYLIAVMFSGKDPYNDRNFLLIFNFLLIGVMAIIFFSIAETGKKQENRIGSIILFALSVLTIIVNCIALSAILFRISEWGMTPNRFAVLGSNLLMLINLLMITYRLYKVVTKKSDIIEVENAIAMFLPIYSIWTIIVTFIFPLIFQFK